jgi:hypothetical protein
MEELCELHAALGNVEECSRGWCAFWEHGGAVVEPGCAIKRIGFDLTNVDLAYHLLDLRRALEQVRSVGEAEAAGRTFDQIRPPGF